MCSVFLTEESGQAKEGKSLKGGGVRYGNPLQELRAALSRG